MKTSLLLFLLFSFNSFAASLSFKLKGKEIASFTMEQIKAGNLKTKNGEIKTSESKIFNVFRGYEKTYEGYDFYLLLDLVYGKDWKSHKKISFIAADGYNQFSWIPQMMKASQGKLGHLAYSEKGKNGFTLVEKKGKFTDPGPLYLVWTNFSEKDKASHADTLKWPYQLVLIDIE